MSDERIALAAKMETAARFEDGVTIGDVMAFFPEAARLLRESVERESALQAEYDGACDLVHRQADLLIGVVNAVSLGQARALARAIRTLMPEQEAASQYKFLLSCPWCFEQFPESFGNTPRFSHLIRCGDRIRGESIQREADAFKRGVEECIKIVKLGGCVDSRMDDMRALIPDQRSSHHVCGMQGFGRLDVCPACSTEKKGT